MSFSGSTHFEFTKPKVLILGCGDPAARAFINCITDFVTTYGYTEDPIRLAASNVAVKCELTQEDPIRLIMEAIQKYNIDFVHAQDAEWEQILLDNQKFFSDVTNPSLLHDLVIDSFSFEGKDYHNISYRDHALLLEEKDSVLTYDPTLVIEPSLEIESDRQAGSGIFPTAIEFLGELGFNFPLYYVTLFLKDCSGNPNFANLEYPAFQLRDTHIHTWVQGLNHEPKHLISPSSIDLNRISNEQIRELCMKYGLTRPEETENTSN